MRCVAIRHDASTYMHGRIVTDRNATHEKRIRVGRALHQNFPLLHVSTIEFIRSNLTFFSAHITGVGTDQGALRRPGPTVSAPRPAMGAADLARDRNDACRAPERRLFIHTHTHTHLLRAAHGRNGTRHRASLDGTERHWTVWSVTGRHGASLEGSARHWTADSLPCRWTRWTDQGRTSLDRPDGQIREVGKDGKGKLEKIESNASCSAAYLLPS